PSSSIIVPGLIGRCLYATLRFVCSAGLVLSGAVVFLPVTKPLQDFVILFRSLNPVFQVRADHADDPFEGQVDCANIALGGCLKQAGDNRLEQSDVLFLAAFCTKLHLSRCGILKGGFEIDCAFFLAARIARDAFWPLRLARRLSLSDRVIATVP